MIHYAKQIASDFSDQEQIEVYCDENAQEEMLRNAHDQLRAYEPDRLNNTISFLSSIAYGPLQAADLIAYELAKHKGDRKHRRRSFERLVRLNPLFSL